MLSPTIAEQTPIRITSPISSLPWLARTAAATSAVSPGDGIPSDSSPMIAGSRYPRLIDKPEIAAREPTTIAASPPITDRRPSGGPARVLEHGQERQPRRHRTTGRQPARF